MDDDFPSQLLKLPDIKGKVPNTRMRSAADLRKLLALYSENDRGRAQQRALVRGNLDGNPPYGSRKRKGMEWTANVNFMGGKARLRAAMQPYNALITGVSYLYECKTAFRKLDPDNQYWNDRITCRFHEMIKKWQGHIWHEQHAIKEMLTEGWAPVVWDCDGDWRFRAVNASSVRVSGDAPSTLDERIPCIGLDVGYRAHELWRKIADEDAATKIGWNVQAVKNAIRQSGKDSKLRSQPWEDWQARLQHHDLSTGMTECDIIRCQHGYVQEFAGKDMEAAVSHFIITEGETHGRDNQEDEFLFKHPRRYKHFGEAMVFFFLDIGDGEWASVRGLAFDSFKHDVLNNRLLCNAANNAFIDSSIVLEAGSQKERDQQMLTVIGPMIFLPAGCKPNQTRIAGGLESVLSASRFFMNDLAQNLGVFNQRTVAPEYAGGEKPTAFQVSQQAQKEGSLTADQVALHFLSRDKVGAEMFRRAVNRATTDADAKAFQKACIDDGVPREALDNMECVLANRLSGYGSSQMRQLVSKELLSVAPMMPETGKNNLLDDFVASTTGNPSLIARYNPPQEKPMFDDALVVLENAAMVDGQTPVIFSGQNNVKHLSGHLAFLADRLVPIRDAMDAGQNDPAALESAYRLLQIAGPHLEAHLGPIESDPSRASLAQQFRGQIEALTNFHGKLRQAIRAARSQARLAQQEEQNANALGALDQAKLRSAQVDDQVKSAKAANSMELKRLDVAHKQQLETAQALHTMQLDRVKAESAKNNGSKE